MKAFNLLIILTEVLSSENTTFNSLFVMSGSTKLTGNLQNVFLKVYSQNQTRYQQKTDFLLSLVCQKPKLKIMLLLPHQ